VATAIFSVRARLRLSLGPELFWRRDPCSPPPKKKYTKLISVYEDSFFRSPNHSERTSPCARWKGEGQSKFDPWTSSLVLGVGPTFPFREIYRCQVQQKVYPQRRRRCGLKRRLRFQLLLVDGSDITEGQMFALSVSW
jgi:hypothetical protein